MARRGKPISLAAIADEASVAYAKGDKVMDVARAVISVIGDQRRKISELEGRIHLADKQGGLLDLAEIQRMEMLAHIMGQNLRLSDPKLHYFELLRDVKAMKEAADGH